MMQPNRYVRLILVIAAIILGITAVVFWVLNLGPHGDPKPSVTDWVSAVGQAVGAIGTAGALWLGAVTFRRQVKDHHRQQASAVTVGYEVWKEGFADIGEVNRGYRYFIRNDSPLPIYDVVLAIGPEGAKEFRLRAVLPPGDKEVALVISSESTMVVGMFADSSGIGWQRDGAGRTAGRLTEIKIKTFKDALPL